MAKRYRVTTAGDARYTGYGQGVWLVQKYDREARVWFDVGTPHDTEAAARAALRELEA